MTRTHREVSGLPGGEGRYDRESLTPARAAERTQAALKFIGGRWKLEIMFQLFGGAVLRFSELERALPGISQKMLAQQLRRMEADGLVKRVVHPEVPPRVDYALTDWGQALCPVLDALLAWAARE